MGFSNVLIFLIAFIAFFGVAFLWGMLRGVSKTRLRGILILASAVAAVITTVIVKRFIATEWVVNTVIIPLVSTFMDASQVDMISSFLGVSQTMNEVLLGSIGALIAPLLCVILFMIYSIITWIVFAIVCLCTSASMKRRNSKIRLKWLRVLIWSLVQTMVVVAIYMIPVSVYSETLSTVLNTMAESDMYEDSEAGDLALVQDILSPIDGNPVTTAYRAAGGKLLCNLITDFEVNGTTTHLNDEVEWVTSFSCQVYRVVKTKFANMSDEEAEMMKAVADSIEESPLLSVIAGEVVYTVTDNWISGEEFFGVDKPDGGELFTPLIDTTLDVFHKDSKDPAALKADLHTLAELIRVLSKYDILADLSNTDALIEKMNGGAAINEMTAVLNQNESMKVLVPEVTNLGMRAISSTLGLSPEEAKLHDTFMADVTTTLNDVKGLDRQTQETEIKNRLDAELKKSGIENVDPAIIDSYSGRMVDDILAKQEAGQEVTEEDVQAFFITYALEELQKQKNNEEGQGSSEVPGLSDFPGGIPSIPGSSDESSDAEKSTNP